MPEGWASPTDPDLGVGQKDRPGCRAAHLEGQRCKMASKTKASEALKVVARCRPLSRKEEAAGHEQILTMDVKLGQVTLRNPARHPGSCPRPSLLMLCMMLAPSRPTCMTKR